MHLTRARMRALNAVVEEGGFSAAARALGISQPAVTQAVRDLERDAGVSLFERRGREIRPTALCAELHRMTAAMQRTETEAERLLERHAKLEVGEFRVGLGNSMPGMAMIRDFRRAAPGVKVSVELGPWSQIVEAVAEERVDVGVLPNVPDDPRFERRTALVQDVVAIVAPDHPLAGLTQASCAQLAAEPLIFRTASSATQRVVDAGFRAAGLRPRPSMVLDTRDGVYEAAANGLGVGFIWELGTGRRDGAARLRVIEFPQGHPEHVFHLAGRSTPLLRLFAGLRI